ncbi:lipoprotein [Mycoplasmopsis canis]|uniref:HinT-interacting membrane complex lipoprotein P60 n=1 Tax=Mycoplasmopsis canis TaxID=29555 RepID=UPI000624AB7C|nr:hypothetical protein [Mycoplasmopsis canis]AKF41481.1 lipoprotein [Mycoplasmopsis canis]
MKFIKKILPLASLSIFPVLTIACGRDVNTTEKIEQDKLFASSNAKDVIELMWLDETLKNVYKISEKSNIENQAFKNEAYQVYKTFVKNELHKDSKYLSKQIADLLSKGALKSDEFKKLQSLLNSYLPEISLEQFMILYLNKESNVHLITNKNLLVHKYLTISNEDEIKKVYSSKYDSRKNDYVLDNFILIDYLINKKITQTWLYESSSDNDVFTSSFKTINNINDYNEISLKHFDSSKVANSDVLFSNREFETTLGGYKGLETTSLSFDYSLATLKELTADSVVSGFYDFSKNNLVKVDSNTKTLANSISISPEGKKVKISYLNRIVPIGKEFTIDNPDASQREKTPKINVKKLTIEGTYFANDLVKLSTSLYSFDQSLYNSAVDAFVALGNKIKLELKDENLKKAIEGLKYAE